MNLKEKAEKYWETKSVWNKISDLIFVILVIAMIFPTSRMKIVVFVKQMTSFSPTAIDKEDQKAVSIADYDWVFETMDGKTTNMKDFSGKTIFINEWATWCPPCVAEMPSLQQLYDQLKDDENIVFLIVTNEKRPRVEAFLKKHGYTFPVVMARSKTPKAFHSESIPVSFLVSPEGKIVLKEYGSQKWHGEETVKLLQSFN